MFINVSSCVLVAGHNSLSWETRVKVAIGAARAIAFLHDLGKPVTYRDFKSSNILLDGVSLAMFFNSSAFYKPFSLTNSRDSFLVPVENCRTSTPSCPALALQEMLGAHTELLPSTWQQVLASQTLACLVSTYVQALIAHSPHLAPTQLEELSW